MSVVSLLKIAAFLFAGIIVFTLALVLITFVIGGVQAIVDILKNGNSNK